MSDLTYAHATWEHPMKLPSCANLREHWGKRAARAASHKKVGCIKTIAARMVFTPWPTGGVWCVHLRRHGVRLLDSDNLASAFKGIRDGVAVALDIDDGDPRIEWLYGQDKCKRGEERVTCRISWVSASPESTLAEPATTPVSKAKSPAGTATRKRSAKGLKRMEVGK
jgi:hypothetical protein